MMGPRVTGGLLVGGGSTAEDDDGTDEGSPSSSRGSAEVNKTSGRSAEALAPWSARRRGAEAYRAGGGREDASSTVQSEAYDERPPTEGGKASRACVGARPARASYVRDARRDQTARRDASASRARGDARGTLASEHVAMSVRRGGGARAACALRSKGMARTRQPGANWTTRFAQTAEVRTGDQFGDSLSEKQVVVGFEKQRISAPHRGSPFLNTPSRATSGVAAPVADAHRPARNVRGFAPRRWRRSERPRRRSTRVC